MPVLKDAIREFKEQLKLLRMQATPEVADQINLALNHIRQMKRDIERECFYGNFTDNVRRFLVRDNVFQRGTTGLCMPTSRQVDKVIDRALATTVNGMRQMQAAIALTVPTLTRLEELVDNFPSGVRARLQEALDYRGPCEELPPSRMISVITLERMKHPVMLACSPRHLVDRDDVEELFRASPRGFSCPHGCGAVTNAGDVLLDRVDLKYLPAPAFEYDDVADVDAWTTGIWQSVLAAAAAAAAEEDLQKEEKHELEQQQEEDTKAD
jgi:hypothetical protein